MSSSKTKETIANDENVNNSITETKWSLEEYIVKRLEAQQHYHSDKASKTQDRFNFYRKVEIVLAAFTPVLITLTTKHPTLEYFAIACSIGVAVIAGLLILGNFQTDWTNHRITSEKLKAEKAFLLTRCEPYDNPNATDEDLLKILTTNVEAILANETQQWFKNKQSSKKQKATNNNG